MFHRLRQGFGGEAKDDAFFKTGTDGPGQEGE